MNMDHACRLCLQSREKMIPIFSKDNSSVNLKSQISDYCSIQISEDDLLPKSICSDCGRVLYSMYKFREQCKRSEQRLYEYYKITENQSLNVTGSSRSQINDCVETPTNDQSFPNEIRNEKINYQQILNTFVNCDNKSYQSNINTEKIIEHSEDQNVDDFDADNSNIENHSNTHECNTESNRNDVSKLKKKQTQRTVVKRFVCNVCKKTFMTNEALWKHTIIHTEIDLLTCDLCSRTFDNKEKLLKHKKKHITGKLLKCEVCSMPFKEEYKLKRHLRVHGKGQAINTKKQYLCDICSRTFVTRSGLLLHLKIHNGLKPFKCTFCSKTFTIISYKKRHERTHTGNKDFVCHICSASFASSNGLKYHLMSHTGETKFDCKTCGKAFKRKKYLKEHIYTHTGERPFACKICGSAYGSSGSLYVHFRKCKSQSNVNSNSSVAKKELTH